MRLNQIKFPILIFTSIWNWKPSYNLIKGARKNVKVKLCLLVMTCLLLSSIPSRCWYLQKIYTRSNWPKVQHGLGRNSVSLTPERSYWQLMMAGRERIIFVWRGWALLGWLYISLPMCICATVIGQVRIYYKIRILEDTKLRGLAVLQEDLESEVEL